MRVLDSVLRMLETSSTLTYGVVSGGVVAAVRAEAGPGRQVLLHAAVHAGTEVQLHVEPSVTGMRVSGVVPVVIYQGNLCGNKSGIINIIVFRKFMSD